jgi:hypothetical protein
VTASVLAFVEAHPVLVIVASAAVIAVVFSDWRRIRRRGP